MGSLAEIREISVKYNISARTLRYYEDMGLIESTRSDGYAYRLYDEAAIRRLEQILILRRLNISIKDIKSIFSTAVSEVILDVLEKKVDHIDEEVSLLHELKSIVLEFIHQIRKQDFESGADIKLLYEKAKDIISGSNKWTASFRTFKNARKALSRILWSVTLGAPTGPRGPALQEFLTARRQDDLAVRLLQP